MRDDLSESDLKCTQLESRLAEQLQLARRTAEDIASTKRLERTRQEAMRTMEAKLRSHL